MRVAEWLTYTDIDQLKQLNRFYQCECDPHSKNELICALLREMSRTSSIQGVLKKISDSELKLLQLLVFDTSTSYTMEELVAKGRSALMGSDENPRALVASAIKKGWLFKGYSGRIKNLYQVPTDIKDRFLRIFVDAVLCEKGGVTPDFYRDEEHLLVSDMYVFFRYLQKDLVRLAGDGSIYKNQQKLLFEELFVKEDPISKKGPRFGFGRNYHLYPDRFSLIYDYAFYQGYILEEEGLVRLSSAGEDVLLKPDKEEAEKIYRFWIRLYRRPIPHLPMVIRWIGLLASQGWILLDLPYEQVKSWINPFYYETVESLFQRVTKMLLHLGVLKIGGENSNNYLCLTSSGRKWIQGVSAFEEETIEEGFIRAYP